ncbi:SDR family NAD(P)-dependent oxidoreductase [Pseudonocardia hydrocarbonoxydans]|uniref:3-oxoacyl-ACP reductase n=1 Tax=Pseudonocardia hydrocarbonoxydans TaxID=76726 RepID=A0A4Y3WQW8_9PSEU|nr:SDR family oxidoreductase [Pseudonocardia hydrocarbonoxydans]GEC21174.1 3-oxoacyl-ACP reductase [Pseudonocardia hydrocarbonoxydans]
MTSEHSGRVVVVTGAAGGIGGRYVASLTAAGALVVAADVAPLAERGTELAEKATAAGPGRAVFVTADITSDDDWAATVDTARREFGRIDALVNNAAIYQGLGGKRHLTALANDEWDRVLTVNVRGTWQAIKAVTPLMRESGGGRIVNISSTVARMGAPGFAHYVASKAAVDGLTRAAARELGPDAITVNAVAPGLVSDEASRTLNTDDYIAMAARGRALGREMAPDDLVGAVLWLAGPSSGFVTGQTVVVDGGGVFT